MMPGDTQSSALPIAADATVGTCQNCAVLHQNLNEYVSSFLALKQKITLLKKSQEQADQVEKLKEENANIINT
uniref:Uncharacterized protein n=1 Tax=Takifugu rubripes TaxID=31033 RepID=A0A674MDC1_TAKRU